MASLLCSGTVAYAQSGFPVYGNNSGCDVHFERSTAEATDMALLKEGRLLFYETACDVLVVGNQDGQIKHLIVNLEKVVEIL